jgi:hypothetical protein
MSIIPSLAVWCSESVTRRGLLNTARISGSQCARISGKVGVRISGTRIAFIQSSPSAPVLTVEEFFPLEQWAESYGHNKWRSFVYAPRELAKAVRDAAIDVIQEMGLKIDRTVSDRHCHLS